MINAKAPWTDSSRWKDIPKQTEFRSETTRGDCWRCCVAAVIGVPAETVPHFMANSEFTAEADTQKWLGDHGWVMVEVGGDITYYAHANAVVIPPPVIEIGPTVRSEKRGQHHAVVTVAGIWCMIRTPRVMDFLL